MDQATGRVQRRASGHGEVGLLSALSQQIQPGGARLRCAGELLEWRSTRNRAEGLGYGRRNDLQRRASDRDTDRDGLPQRGAAHQKADATLTKPASSDSPGYADGSSLSRSRPKPLSLSVLRHPNEWRFIYGRIP